MKEISDEKLHIIIEIVNVINDQTDDEHLQKLYDMLEYINPIPNSDRGMDPKEYRTKQIIKEIERRLTAEQLEVFYSEIKDYYKCFISSDKVKIEVLKDLIQDIKFISYNGNINYGFGKLFSSIEDTQIKKDIFLKIKDHFHLGSQIDLLCYIDDDYLKLSFLLEQIEKNPEYDYTELILSLKDDEIKQQFIEEYKNVLEDEIPMYQYVASLSNDKTKVDFIRNQKLTSLMIRKIISGMTNEECILELWDLVDADNKVLLIQRLKSDEKKIEYILKLDKIIDGKVLKRSPQILSAMIVNFPRDKYLEILKQVEHNLFDVNTLIEYEKDENLVIQIITKFPNKRLYFGIRLNKKLSPQKIFENIDFFLDIEKVKNKEELKNKINYLYSKNNDIVYCKNWEILDDKYVNIFGIDKLNIIASFHDVVDDILALNDKQLLILSKCIDRYVEKYQTTEWIEIVNKIILEFHYLADIILKDYVDNIKDLDNINIDNLLFVLTKNGIDYIDIKTDADINNFFNLLKLKHEKDIKSEDLSVKINAVLLKKYGITDQTNLLRKFTKSKFTSGMKYIYYLYGNDIELIENEQIKAIFRDVKCIVECTDSYELERIYYSIDKPMILDTYLFEKEIKKEFMKLYNKELLQLSSLEQVGENMYDAGVDFSIISTSVGAFVANNPDDYNKDWNRVSLASPHFCTNFIRNDMLGTAPVPHLMYGFSHMSDDSLVLSGATDIASSGNDMVSSAQHDERYFAPDTMINNTYQTRYKFNEMDFMRIQNNQKKQPDYILVMQKNGVIENIEEARRASKQWDNLPIVVIDVDKCLKSELNKLKIMIQEYVESPNEEKLQQIITKINNNRVTQITFAESVDIEQLKGLLDTVSVNRHL